MDESGAGGYGAGAGHVSAGSPRRSQRLHEAMRYAVLDGGKRVRPLLVHAAGELHGADRAVLARAAAAVEMIHAYSLVHDDMPCMDDDELRRGKPTVHVEYDEATALLVGDALQAQAFLILSEAGVTDAARQVAMLHLLAQAGGSVGMCGGQAIDLESVGIALSLPQLEQMHRLKTGALLRAAVMLGALVRQEPVTDAESGGAGSVCGGCRLGVSSGRRRPGRDRGFDCARQNSGQGCGRQQADLRNYFGPGSIPGLGGKIARRRASGSRTVWTSSAAVARSRGLDCAAESLA